MKYLVRDLVPGKAYTLQFRSKAADGSVSNWSRQLSLTTTSDTTAPKTPTGLVVGLSGNAFTASWNAVTQSSDNSSATDLRQYLVRVSSSLAGGTKTFTTRGTSFELSYEQNAAIFGSAKASITFEVAADDLFGNTSAFSAGVSATNPAPAAPTGVSGNTIVDGVIIKWNANTELDLAGYKVYSGTTSGSQTTLEWSGVATTATIPTTLYATDKWYKVVAFDVFSTESTGTVVGPFRPGSPFATDTTAPSVPSGLAASLTNSTDGRSATANVSWTAVTDTDNDLSEYVIGYRPAGATDWQYAKVDYTNTTTQIGNLLPYTNYEFRIRSSDFSANLSTWSTTVTATATANTAPATVTGVTVTAGRESVTVSWNANTEADVVNGAGTYMVDIATNTGFTTPFSYRTGATNITVTGLAQNQTYYARVKAVDSLGLSSASWSATANGTTGTYPSASPSDGAVPTGAPTLTAAAGLGYVYLNWTPVTNADPVVYDVYMSTTSGFTTYDATTKITEVFGTSAIVDTTVAGASLAYGTTYYFKVRARDRDGSSTSISAQASAAPYKASTSDISTIDAGLITSNSSFTTNLFIGTGGAIQSTGYTSGGSTGFQLSNTGLVIKGTNNIVDVAAVSAGTISAKTWNVGAGGVINVDASGQIKSNNYSSGSTGYQLSNTGLEINDGSVDAKVLKTNSAIIGDLIIGQAANSLGSLKSFGYAAGVSGFKLDKTGLEINNGSIAAAALKIQDSDNIMPPEYAGFEFTSTFYTGKFAFSGSPTASIVNTGARFGYQALRVTATAANSTFTHLAPNASTYNVQVEPNETYILSAYMRCSSASLTNVSMRFRNQSTGGTYLNFATLDTTAGAAGWTRVSATFTAPADASLGMISIRADFAAVGDWYEVDGIQLERKVAGINTPSPWTPPGVTSVDAGVIRTGELRSTSMVTVNGVQQPAWAINLAGNAQLGNAFVRGTLVIGDYGDPDNGQSEARSGNFVSGYDGWRIGSDGDVEFNSGVFRGTLSGNEIYGPTIATTSDQTVDRIEIDSFGISVYEEQKINLIRRPHFSDLAVGTTTIPKYTGTSASTTVRNLPASYGTSTEKMIVLAPSASTGYVTYSDGVTTLQPGKRYWLNFKFMSYSPTSYSGNYGVGVKADDFKIIEGVTGRVLQASNRTEWLGDPFQSSAGIVSNGYVFSSQRSAPTGTDPNEGDLRSGSVGLYFDVPSDWNGSPISIRMPAAGWRYNGTTWIYLSAAKIGYSFISLVQEAFSGGYPYGNFVGTVNNSISVKDSYPNTELRTDSALGHVISNISSLSFNDLSASGGYNASLYSTGGSLTLTGRSVDLNSPVINLVSSGYGYTSTFSIGPDYSSIYSPKGVKTYSEGDLEMFTSGGSGAGLYVRSAGYTEMQGSFVYIPSATISAPKMQSVSLVFSDATTLTYTSATATSMGARGGRGTFIAPQSGAVLVLTNGQYKTSSAGQYAAIGFEIRVGSSTGTIFKGYDIDDSVLNFNDQWIRSGGAYFINGLTPGQTYYIQNMAASGGGSGVTGSFAQGRIIVVPQM